MVCIAALCGIFERDGYADNPLLRRRQGTFDSPPVDSSTGLVLYRGLPLPLPQLL
jgi:hypothetical protein